MVLFNFLVKSSANCTMSFCDFNIKYHMGISDINMSSGLIPSKILTNPTFFSTVNQTLKKAERRKTLYSKTHSRNYESVRLKRGLIGGALSG